MHVSAIEASSVRLVLFKAYNENLLRLDIENFVKNEKLIFSEK